MSLKLRKVNSSFRALGVLPLSCTLFCAETHSRLLFEMDEVSAFRLFRHSPSSPSLLFTLHSASCMYGLFLFMPRRTPFPSKAPTGHSSCF